MFTDGASRFSSTISASHEEMNSSTTLDVAQSDFLDDVFGGDSDDEHDNRGESGNVINVESVRNHDVSDVPRLRGIHTTNGYRDGISASKEKFLQEGFDEGYSLGAEIGAAAGKLIGILEGLVSAVRTEDLKAELGNNLEQARLGLSAKNLYSPEFFGEDGIWKYDVGDAGEDEDVTFRVVASKHPVIIKWGEIVDGLLMKHGLQTISS